MKIVVIGASGLVGSNCLKYFTEQNLSVIGTYFSYQTSNTKYYDTINLENLANFDIVSFAPDCIVHCGALTNVDYCEAHEDESYSQNVTSTLNLINICKKTKAKLVFISTDYVFDGQSGPYRETDLLNPVNQYGFHKKMAEEAVQLQLADALILRITNVYGDEKRNKNFIARLIETHKNNLELHLNLPSDQYASPVNASDIAKSLYLLLKNGSKGVYHIASSDFYNRFSLASKVLSYLPGNKITILPVLTNNMNQGAKRPLTGGLLALKFMAEFPDFLFSNVDAYLKNKIHDL